MSYTSIPQLTTLASSQKGESMTGYFAMVIVFVMSIKLGLAIIPFQIDDRGLDKIIGAELHKANTNKKTPKQLLAAIEKVINMNGYRETKLDEDYTVTKTTPGSIVIEKNYTRESMLFPTVFITNRFEGVVEEITPE